MRVQAIPVGPFESNCYLLSGGCPGAALVIDPGDDAPAISAALAAARLTVAAYLLTHGHVDHVSALAALLATAPAPVLLHARDATWAFSAVNALPPYYPAPRPPPSPPRLVAEGQRLQEAGFEAVVLETPGHSPGSVSFYFPTDGALFPGDVLFSGSIGRTDLPGGDPSAMRRSLARLLELPDTTAVYPGHGPATTLGEERRTNPFLA